MKRKFNSLQKDSEQLVEERRKVAELTLDIAKATEKEEAATAKEKEATKKLTRCEKNLTEVTTARDDLQRKYDFLDEKHANLEKEHKELVTKYQNASEDLNMLQSQNEKYRGAIVKNEGVLSAQTKELREALKRAQVGKADADRFRDENAVLVKQNQKLVKDLAEAEEAEPQRVR